MRNGIPILWHSHLNGIWNRGARRFPSRPNIPQIPGHWLFDSVSFPISRFTTADNQTAYRPEVVLASILLRAFFILLWSLRWQPFRSSLKSTRKGTLFRRKWNILAAPSGLLVPHKCQNLLMIYLMQWSHPKPYNCRIVPRSPGAAESLLLATS